MRGAVSVAEEHLILGDLELLIMAKHVLQRPVLHEIFVIGGDFKGSKIRQEFIELGEQTKVMVDADLRLSGMMRMSAVLGKNNFEQAYDKILDDFVRIAET